MKKNLTITLLFFSLIIQAQSPLLNVKGKDSLQVKMNQMIVNVKIIGNIAYTTTEMHFGNKSSQQMEAELLFPLPEGVSVSRFAIDINGKIRDAVPINKNKGKQVFEAIAHRRVDPGLLEKVEGNNFKTRIYPIMPNSERIVIIGYEQELVAFDKDNLNYQILSKYAHKLDKFEVIVNVIGVVSKPILSDNNIETNFEPVENTTWNKSFQTAIKKSNYQPMEKLNIKIPIQQNYSSIVTQTVNNQHYFYANTYLENNKILKKKPVSIGIIWDRSLSCKNRDLKKELDFLEAYFNNLQNTKVTLYILSFNFEKKETYNIVDGNWSALKSDLEKVTYDGGTRFSQINFPNHEEFLFFSDGLSSLSNNNLARNNKPFYTITSSVSSDFSFLSFNATKTRASFINLNQINIQTGIDKLIYQNLKFLGIKENFMVTELFPSIGSSVSGNFSISGISLKAKNEITLLFGYDENPILEKKIWLDTEIQNSNDVNIEKLWAQKKIANLELQYKKNEDEIELMGNKYGIATQNTSLIVLENINDYIAYDITPPAELRAEYDRIIKQQREASLAKQHNNWENINQYSQILYSWWNKDIKFITPKPIPKPKVIKVKNNNQANGNISGIVSDELGVLPGANIIIRGTNTGLQSDVDGRYNIKAKKGDQLVFSYIGYNDKIITIGNTGTYNARLSQSGSNLETVVVTAMGMRKKNAVSYSSSIASAKEISKNSESSNTERSQNNAPENQNLEDDKMEDKDYETFKYSDTIVENQNFKQKNIKITSWSPDRIYLKVLKETPNDKKYLAYLQLRDDNENNPNFYFDVANYFYDNNEKPKALLILSNIADLGLENHQLYKSLTYVLRQWEAFEEALFTANQVAKWRAQEPQAHRDLALTLEDNKQYQAAFDELIKALDVNYYGEMSGQYKGVEDIILMDINRLMSDHPNIKTGKLEAKYFKKMPVAVRIILNWNQMDTDIDLHVIEPNGEECYFGHRDTKAGAKFSKDFTQGYGPEQYLLRNAVKGKFQIKTNYYGESILTQNGPTTVMVEVYTQKSGKTKRTLQTIQLGTIKEQQNLAEIIID